MTQERKKQQEKDSGRTKRVNPKYSRILRRLNKALGLNMQQCNVFYDVFCNCLIDELSYSHKVELRGLGKFKMFRTKYGIYVKFIPKKDFQTKFEVDTGDVDEALFK